MTHHAHILSRSNTLWTQGISALMIMLMHFVMQTDGYPRFLNILGSIGVAAFLFISGFGINESYKASGLKRFWSKRVVRVVMPCWMIWLLRLPFVEQFDIYQLMRNMMFFNSELWFVDFIIRWYFIYWCVRKIVPQYTTVLLALFSVVFVFTPQLTSEQSFSFFFGYFVSQHYVKVKSVGRTTILRFMFFTFSYGIVFTLVKELHFVRTFIGTLPFNIILLNIKLPLAISVITAPYLFPWVKKIKPIIWFGKISYEIYIVHFNFMPFVTGAASIIKYIVYSTVMGVVFNKFNAMLRKNIVTSFAAVIYIGVCYILVCKYSMRITDSFGYVCIPYIIVLIAIILLSQQKQFFNIRHVKTVFWTMLLCLTLIMLTVQYHFDPMENKVDRWSAIANPLTALFHGEFPYLAQTHLGGNASPFPVWIIFHIPFWLLNNVGLSEVFTAVVFIYSVKMAHGYESGIRAILLLGMSLNLWYETSVRSDLISNFLLLATFINYLIAKRVTFASCPIMLSMTAGLWLSTRLSVAFPLFIMFFPFWIKLSAKQKIICALLPLFIFCITFLPLVLWDYNSLFYAENNPFSLQTRQGYPVDSIVLIIVATVMAMNWKQDTNKLMLFSAAILVFIPILSYGHNMYVYSNWTDIFNSAYDITYLDSSLPFCITLLSTRQYYEP